MTPVRTLVVDDSAPMRKAIRDLLRGVTGCSIVGEGANGLEGLELARALHPDLIVMDLHMPVMGGLEAIRLLKKEFSLTEVVLISVIMEPELRKQGLHLGAIACLEKGDELWQRLPPIVSQLADSSEPGPV